MQEIISALGMGEYGIYVWPSFAVAALIITIMLVMSLASLRRTQKTLTELQNNKEQIQ